VNPQYWSKNGIFYTWGGRYPHNQDRCEIREKRAEERRKLLNVIGDFFY
jgi:hypothetical protein